MAPLQCNDYKLFLLLQFELLQVQYFRQEKRAQDLHRGKPTGVANPWAYLLYDLIRGGVIHKKQHHQ
jgi:hypothetical protein